MRSEIENESMENMHVYDVDIVSLTIAYLIADGLLHCAVPWTFPLQLTLAATFILQTHQVYFWNHMYANGT